MWEGHGKKAAVQAKQTYSFGPGAHVLASPPPQPPHPPPRMPPSADRSGLVPSVDECVDLAVRGVTLVLNIYLHTHTHTHTHSLTLSLSHTHTYLYIYINVYIYVYLSVCLSLSLSFSLSLSLCACVYIGAAPQRGAARDARIQRRGGRVRGRDQGADDCSTGGEQDVEGRQALCGPGLGFRVRMRVIKLCSDQPTPFRVRMRVVNFHADPARIQPYHIGKRDLLWLLCEFLCGSGSHSQTSSKCNVIE